MATEIKKEAEKFGLWHNEVQRWILEPEFEAIEKSLQDDYSTYYQIRNDNKFGLVYCNYGKIEWLLQPIFGVISIKEFHSCYRVETDKKFGLVLHGKWLIQPKFDAIEELDYNYYRIQNDNKSGLFYHYCATRELLLPAIYDAIEKLPIYRYNIHTYRVKSGTKFGLILCEHTVGIKLIIQPEYDAIEKISDFLYRIQANNKFGLVFCGVYGEDKCLLNPEFDTVFIEKLNIKYDDYYRIKADNKVGIVLCGNTKIEWLIHPKFENASIEKLDGDYHLTLADNKVGLTCHNEVLLEPEFDFISVEKINEQYLYQIKADNKFGLLYHNKWLLKPELDLISVKNFEDYKYLYKIQSGDKFGLLVYSEVTKWWHWLLQPEYDAIERVGFFRYRIKSDNKFGIIHFFVNKSNDINDIWIEWVLGIHYDAIEAFFPFYKIRLNNKLGLTYYSIYILSTEHHSVSVKELVDNCYKIEADNKFGLIFCRDHLVTEWLLQPKFNNIEVMHKSEDLYQVCADGRYGLFRCEKHEIEWLPSGGVSEDNDENTQQ